MVSVRRRNQDENAEVLKKEDIQLAVRIGGRNIQAQAAREELGPLFFVHPGNCGSSHKKGKKAAKKTTQK